MFIFSFSIYGVLYCRCAPIRLDYLCFLPQKELSLKALNKQSIPPTCFFLPSAPLEATCSTQVVFEHGNGGCT